MHALELNFVQLPRPDVDFRELTEEEVRLGTILAPDAAHLINGTQKGALQFVDEVAESIRAADESRLILDG